MQHPKSRYRYLTALSMLYMTVKLTTVMMIYKIIYIGSFSASASTLLMPLWFFLGDVITEVYGYTVARHLIWIAIFCQIFFALVCSSLIYMPSPSFWTEQVHYEHVFSKLPRVALASSLSILFSALINSYSLTKWKILLKGKYFWVRSIAASAVGELVFILIAYCIEFIGVLPFEKILSLMTLSFASKLVLSPVLVIPSIFLASFLKKAEGLDVYDYHTDFTPFTLKLYD